MGIHVGHTGPTNGNGRRPTWGKEKREHTRYPFTASVEALDTNSRSRMTARTADVGRGGCYVDTYCPFPLNTDVKLRITREQKSFTALAKVVYSKLGMGMGLSFTEVELRQQPVLEKWISDVSGDAPMDFVSEEDCLETVAQKGFTEDASSVLAELIRILMHRGALSRTDGNAMLMRLLRK